MSISVCSTAIGAYQYTGTTQRKAMSAVSFTERTEQTQEVSDAEKLENFKKEIWNEINSMPWGANTSIQITDGAFKKMMEDGTFKNKMMKIIREDAIGSNMMCGGTLINIDENGYKGYSYMEDHAKEANSAFATHSKGKDAFYVKKAEKKREYMKLLEETWLKRELSEAKEMELFKKKFYDDLSKVTNHRTVSNAAVNISEATFKAMKDDPQYREKFLSLIQRDWGSSYAPMNCSVLITVGATLNEYRADSWSVGYDSEFDVRSQNSFYKRTSEKKNRQKELLEEYLEKRTQAKKQQQELLNEKIAKAEQERSRLARAWSSEKQMAKVFSAYEARQRGCY